MSREQKIKTLMTGCVLILAAVVILTVSGVFKGALGLSYEHEDKYSIGETTVSKPVRNLEIGWVEGKVNILYHSGETVEISEKSNKAIGEDMKLRWWLDGDTLRIQYAKSGIRLAWNQSKELTLTLPEGTTLAAAKITATSADLNIAALKAEKLEMICTSGAINASAEAGEVRSVTTSGDQKLTLTGKQTAVAIGSTSGSLVLEAEEAEQLKGETTSGGITVTGVKSLARVDLGSTSGSISFRCEKTETVTIGSTSGDIRVETGAFGSLKAEATSGSVTAVLPGEPGFTAELNTTSGSKETKMAMTQEGNRYICGDGSGTVKIGTTSGNVRLEPWQN